MKWDSMGILNLFSLVAHRPCWNHGADLRNFLYMKRVVLQHSLPVSKIGGGKRAFLQWPDIVLLNWHDYIHSLIEGGL